MFSAARKAFALKQAKEGIPVGKVSKKAGLSQTTFFQLEENIWRDATE